MTLFAAALAWLFCAGAAIAGLPPWLGAPAALACAALLPARTIRSRAGRLAVAGAVVAAATVQLAPGRAVAPPQSVARLDGEEARLRLRAEDEGDLHPAYQTVSAAAQMVEAADGWRAASGRVRLTLPPTTHVLPGDGLEVFGRIDAVSRAGAARYAAWLADRGVVATMAPRGSRLVKRAAPSAPVRLWRSARDGVVAGLGRALPPREAAFAAALLFGTRHALPRAMQADLAASGASHLVTISAFNLLLLYGVLVASAAPLIGRRWALLLAFVAACAYGSATGWHPPAIRGGLLAGLLTLAAWSGRPYSPTALLVLAAAAMTVPDARLLRDAGFQLTFAAAAGIAVLGPTLRAAAAACFAKLDPDGAAPLASAATASLLVSLAASLATVPVLAAQFGAVPLYAPLVNALINPLTPLLTFGALAVGAVAALLPDAGAALAAPLWLSLRGIELLVHAVALSPGAMLPVRAAGPPLAAAWYAALLLVPRVWQWRKRRAAADRPARARAARRRSPAGRRLREWAPGFAAAALIVVASVGGPRLSEAVGAHVPSVTVEWLAVDGGAAILITARDGERVLTIDRAAPAAIAQAVEEAAGDGRGVAALIWDGGAAADADALRQTAAALHAGVVLRAAASPAGAAEAVNEAASAAGAADRELNAASLASVPAGGRYTLALGGDDALDLLDDGHSRLALVLRSGGRSVVLRDTPDLVRLLGRWREPVPLAAIALRRRALTANRDLLRDLQPALVLLEGRWPQDAREALQTVAGGARVVSLAEAPRLRPGALPADITVGFAAR